MYKKKAAKKKVVAPKALPAVETPPVVKPSKKAAVHNPFGHLVMVHFPYDENQRWIMNGTTRKFFRASKFDEQLVLDGKVVVVTCDTHPATYVFSNGLEAFVGPATPSELGLE